MAVVWGLLSKVGHVAAIEEVRLSKTSENTRLDCVVITRPRRASLQFLHPNHAQSPLAGFCGAPFRAIVSRVFLCVFATEKAA
jgi:hypothetical protein